MRTPGLVARLMGLEALPAVQKDKLKKASLSASVSNNGDTFERRNFAVEKGESKHELRPQKLQKTGMSERRAVTRFGAETLQLKNVLSRSRKQHPKLASPVKSPRNLSGKNTSRLIGAATKILEPGLQRSRSKCALTYSSAVHHPPATDKLIREPTGISLEPSENSNYLIGGGAAAAQNGQSSSCRNCAHLLANREEQPSVFSPMSNSDACFSADQMDDPRVPVFCSMRGKMKDQETSPLYTSMDGGQPRHDYMDMVDNKPLNREGQRQWQTTSPQRKLQRDVCPSVGLKPKGLGQKHTLQERDRLPLRSKVSRPAVSRNLGNHSRLTLSAKMDNCQLETDRKIGERRHDPLSPVRKKRSMNIARQNECTGFVSSSLIKSTNARSNGLPGKETNSPCSKPQENRNRDSGKNEIGVVSFTFNSQMKRKTGINAEAEERTGPNGSNCEVPVKKSAFQKTAGKRSSQGSCSMSGDSLGALLEEKLRELTCQEEEESTLGDTAPRKTTAMILQELISALTPERPFHQDDLACNLKIQRDLLHADDRQPEMSSPPGVQVSILTLFFISRAC